MASAEREEEGLIVRGGRTEVGGRVEGRLGAHTSATKYLNLERIKKLLQINKKAENLVENQPMT